MSVCSGEKSISESSRNDLSANITIIVGHHEVPSAPTPPDEGRPVKFWEVSHIAYAAPRMS